MSSRRTKAQSRSASPEIIGGVRAATIVELGEGGGVSVRVGVTDAAADPVFARLTLLGGYAPTVGDRVLVAGDEELYVIAILSAARSPSLSLSDGATATVEGDGLALRDREGRLLIRYEPGKAVLAVPEGDLASARPTGGSSSSPGST